MKRIVSICGSLFVMALLPQNHKSPATQGNDPAWEQIAAAKGAGVDTDPKQCSIDANAWFDNSSDSEQLPTLELLKRKYEMDACYATASRAGSARRETSATAFKMGSLSYRYTYELFIRARDVLADHKLLNEFLRQKG